MFPFAFWVFSRAWGPRGFKVGGFDFPHRTFLNCFCFLENKGLLSMKILQKLKKGPTFFRGRYQEISRSAERPPGLCGGPSWKGSLYPGPNFFLIGGKKGEAFKKKNKFGGENPLGTPPKTQN